MTTLAKAILSIEYEPSLGIWAKLVDGKFRPDSPARIGQVNRKSGGMFDDMEFFCNGEEPTDFIQDWYDSVIDLTLLVVTDESIIKFVEFRNEMRAISD